MLKNGLKLGRAEGSLKVTPRGEYQRLIEKFIASGEDELPVALGKEEPRKVYTGLQNTVTRKGYRGLVGVCRRRRDIHLIRLG